jgi:hypothetical protein
MTYFLAAVPIVLILLLRRFDVRATRAEQLALLALSLALLIHTL